MQPGFGLGQHKLNRGRGDLRVLEEVFDRLLEALGDDPQSMGRGLRPAQLDLVQEGPAEVAAGDRRQAQAEILAGLPDSGSEGLARPGVRPCRAAPTPLVKQGLQSNKPCLTCKRSENAALRPEHFRARHDSGRQGQRTPQVQKAPQLTHLQDRRLAARRAYPWPTLGRDRNQQGDGP